MLKKLANGVFGSRRALGWLLVAGSCVQLSGCGGDDDDTGGTAGKGTAAGGGTSSGGKGNTGGTSGGGKGNTAGTPNAGKGNAAGTGGVNSGVGGEGGATGGKAGKGGTSAATGGKAGKGGTSAATGGKAGKGGTSAGAGGSMVVGGDAGVGGQAGAGAESGEGGAGAGAGGSSGEGGAAGERGAPDGRWRLTELHVDGYPDSAVVGVTADGTYVAGRVWDHAVDPNGDITSATLVGVRWNDATPTLLVQSGWSHAWPVGISGDGMVIAGSRFMPGSPVAFYWNESGAHDLPHPPGSGFVEVDGISGDGLHVVGSVTDTSNDASPVVWDSGTVRFLQPVSFSSFALAADHDGATIVGYALEIRVATAVRWGSAGGSLLDSRTMNPQTFAKDVSDDGQVIVGYEEQSSTPWAFRYVSNGLEYLPAPADATTCVADRTNGDGSIIVGACDGSAGWLLWHGSGYVTLDSVFTELGIDVSAYTSLSLSDISADGTTLIANAKVGANAVGLRIRIDGATLPGSSP